MRFTFPAVLLSSFFASPAAGRGAVGKEGKGKSSESASTVRAVDVHYPKTTKIFGLTEPFSLFFSFDYLPSANVRDSSVSRPSQATGIPMKTFFLLDPSRKLYVY